MASFAGEAVDRIGGEPVAARMARKAPIRHLDPSLLLVTMLLSAFGALMVYSATVHRQVAAGLDPNTFLRRQLLFLIGGAVLLFVMSMFDYRWLRGVAPVVYVVTIAALVIVLTPLGDEVSGARRWINLGPLQAQPSEIGKIALLLTLAAFISSRKAEMRLRDVGISLLIVALPAGLIYLEPDLGTTLVFTVLAAALLFVGGTKLRYLLGLVVLAGVAIAMVLQMGLLKDYQISRLTAFRDPNPDVQEEGFNLFNSKIAIGSGGIRGKGLEGKNTQTSLDFVPEQHTDFIFTAVGEQLGFVGAASLLALYGFLVWRALRIAHMSRDFYGTLVAVGIAAMWAFQIFINIGMTMGIMPITGIPLPFLSYGGSSLLTNYVAVGLLLNIHMRRFV